VVDQLIGEVQTLPPFEDLSSEQLTGEDVPLCDPNNGRHHLVLVNHRSIDVDSNLAGLAQVDLHLVGEELFEVVFRSLFDGASVGVHLVRIELAVIQLHI